LPSAYTKKNYLTEYLLHLQLPANFFQVIRSREFTIGFLLQAGAISPKRTCKCQSEMAIIAHENGYMFGCECGALENLIQKTLWEPAKVTNDQILLYIFLWVMGIKPSEI